MRDPGWPPRRRRRHPSKYQPLADALAAQHGDTARFTFAEIEALLGAPLPPMARRTRHWWRNQRSTGPHVRAWLDAGWQVAAVDPAVQTVTFTRQQPPTGGARRV